jgi:hypothetical protein
VYIFPSTGKYRPILGTYNYYSTNPIIQIEAEWWQNTADAIQDISIFASSSDSITGKIRLYKIPLK